MRFDVFDDVDDPNDHSRVMMRNDDEGARPERKVTVWGIWEGAPRVHRDKKLLQGSKEKSRLEMGHPDILIGGLAAIRLNKGMKLALAEQG